METADDVAKLLDNGWRIELFKNLLGSYAARATKPKCEDPRGTINHVIEIDDFTPSKALYRLAEKAVMGRIVGES